MAKIIRIETPEYIRGVLDEKDYIVKGSSGMGNWSQLPWIGIFNPKITSSAQSGYYIVYLFKEDMQGVYLSLNQGVTDLKEKYGNKEAKIRLKDNSKNFREKINDKTILLDGLLESISLGTGNYAPFYEAGNIYAKYYPLDDLPSENILISDFNNFIKIYNQLTDIPQLRIRDFIKTILVKYLEAKNDEKLARDLITKYANKNGFQKYLAKIANQTINGNLDTYGYFGGANRLNLIPKVTLFDKNSSSPFFLRFSFREDMSGAYLSLTDDYGRFEAIMHDKGIIFDKFDEKYQNYIKETVAKVRNELKQLTSIEDDFLEDINLHSKKSIKASAIEAANIYAKYYSLENLPSEETFKSDFKELLTLYDLLKDDGNNLKIIENPQEIKEAEYKFRDILL